MNKIIKSDLEWKKILSEEEYYVTRQKGTEPAFSGKAFDISKDGIFKCRCCGAKLFERTSKYESGCGWPSFFKGISKQIFLSDVVLNITFNLRKISMSNNQVDINFSENKCGIIEKLITLHPH